MLAIIQNTYTSVISGATVGKGYENYIYIYFKLGNSVWDIYVYIPEPKWFQSPPANSGQKISNKKIPEINNL